MEHVDVLITTEEDARVVFGVGGTANDRFESVDAEAYADVARALYDRFNVTAGAITLRENPRVWTNSWSAIVYAEGKGHRAPRYEVETVDRIGAGDPSSAGTIFGMLRCAAWSKPAASGLA